MYSHHDDSYDEKSRKVIGLVSKLWDDYGEKLDDMEEFESMLCKLYSLDHDLTEGGFLSVLGSPGPEYSYFKPVTKLLNVIGAFDVIELFEQFYEIYGEMPEDYVDRVWPITRQHPDDPEDAHYDDDKRIALVEALDSLGREYYKIVTNNNVLMRLHDSLVELGYLEK